MLIQRLHPDDDAIVALTPLCAGQEVELDGKCWLLAEDIGAKHKFAARDFAPGDFITMYGAIIGRAKCDIPAGRLLTQQNVSHAVGDLRSARTGAWSAPDVSAWAGRTFDGYRREATVDAGKRWEPSEIGAAVAKVLADAQPLVKVYGA